MSDLSLKSWWEWDGMENSDLWYNCRFDNFTGTWLCASSKETGKAPFHFVHLHKSGFTWTGEIWELTLVMCVGMFSQSGSRQCRSWWSSLWSSPRSPFWCSWVNCSPCPRVDFSTSPGCVKSSHVTVECNNVPPTLIWMRHLKRMRLENCSSRVQELVGGEELDTVPTWCFCTPIICNYALQVTKTYCTNKQWHWVQWLYLCSLLSVMAELVQICLIGWIGFKPHYDHKCAPYGKPAIRWQILHTPILTFLWNSLNKS